MSIDFWIPVQYIPKDELPPNPNNDPCILVKIPDHCPTCKTFLALSVGQTISFAKKHGSAFGQYCSHVLQYDQVWNIRIKEQPESSIRKDLKDDGCSCKKCQEWYPMAEPNQADGTLICYSCRKLS